MPEPVRQNEGFPGQRLMVLPAELVKRATRLPVTMDLAVTHLGHFATAPGHYVQRPRGSGQWLLIYCLEGAGSVHTRGNRLELGTGDLTILEPKQAHEYQAATANPWSLFWVHFIGQRASAYLDALGWSRSGPVLHVPDAAMMLAAFEDLYRHTLHGVADAEMLAMSTSMARLFGLARLGIRARDTRARQREDKILAVMARLRDEPQHPWTVEAMARLAGLSAGHFSELFRQQTGSPPQTYLIRLRLQLACRILDQEQASIEQTANRIGYEDAYYFSRLFRRHLGVAPSRFRRDARAGR